MRINYLHGSSDLYGASQMLRHEVGAAIELGHKITVVLPDDGDLVSSLEGLGARVLIEPDLRVLRRVSPASAFRRRPASLPAADVTVLWTLALLGEVHNARRSGRLGISVHELLLDPVGMLLRQYLRREGLPVQYNSDAVRAWLLDGGIPQNSMVKALPVVSPQVRVNRRTVAPSSASPFTMLLMGRVNGTKGHLETAAAVSGMNRDDIRLILAGSPFPGQEAHLAELDLLVANDRRLQMIGQVQSIESLAPVLDVVLTVATRPESLGLQPLEFWSLGVRSAGWSWGGQAEVLPLVDGVPLPHAPEWLGQWLELLVENWRIVSSAPSVAAPAARACSAGERLRATANFLDLCLSS